MIAKVDKSIIANGVTMTVKEAMKNAAEVHDQTGLTVEVSSTLGDPIALFYKGGCIEY